MDNEHYGNLILNTIDQLRKRKARPDLERICHMLQRHYGLNSAVVRCELERLITEDRVIKVDYKGSESYRNAAKWSKAKYREFSIKKEVEEGETCIRPIKRPGPGRPRKYPLPEGVEKPPEKRGRPRKHFKKSIGLNNVDPPVVPDSTIQEDTCTFCGFPASNNNKATFEPLLCCKDCKVKAHPSCMEYTPELAARSRMAPWQCMYCKSCAVCNGSESGDTMLFCDACDKGYHMGCHNPIVITKPTGRWMCSQCIDYSGDIAKEIEKAQLAMKRNDNCLMKLNSIDTSGFPTPCDSPVPEDENYPKDEKYPKLNGDADATTKQQYPYVIPDPKDWTIDEVVKFFFAIGFPEQADAFREQEIDGKSLLLLKRNDVLTGLSIKLGPALKIYNHVKRLQTGLPDENLHL